MEDNVPQFSLDTKRVDEKELRSQSLFPVSIMASTVEFSEDITDVELTRKAIYENALKKFPFTKVSTKSFKEGFLEFNETNDNTLTCFYAKETPVKIMYENDDLRIHSQRYSLLNPSYTVRLKISVGQQSVRVTMFGGSDALISRALTLANICVIGSAKGNHKVVHTTFDKNDMNQILKNFSDNVEYIWIHPGESEKFVKFVEKKEGNKISKIPEYIVHAKLHGFHIISSPIVLSLIEESGVFLKEIQGRLPFGAGRDVTCRVSSEGKALFYIPDFLVPQKSSAYEVAESLYDKLVVPVSNVGGSRQTKMGDF